LKKALQNANSSLKFYPRKQSIPGATGQVNGQPSQAVIVIQLGRLAGDCLRLAFTFLARFPMAL
jgi:hypothetical protein